MPPAAPNRPMNVVKTAAENTGAEHGENIHTALIIWNSVIVAALAGGIKSEGGVGEEADSYYERDGAHKTRKVPIMFGGVKHEI